MQATTLSEFRPGLGQERLARPDGTSTDGANTTYVVEGLRRQLGPGGRRHGRQSAQRVQARLGGVFPGSGSARDNDKTQAKTAKTCLVESSALEYGTVLCGLQSTDVVYLTKFSGWMSPAALALLPRLVYRGERRRQWWSRSLRGPTGLGLR